MASPRIVLCPGQGAQVVGMGKAWYDASPEARKVFHTADELLGDRFGAPLSLLCFEGPVERLNQTDAAQPALYVAGVACWRGLLAQWHAGGNAGGAAVEASVLAIAGLSLGEYTALHLAGAFSFEDGLELVAVRGRAMQDAAEAVPSGMVALIGADEAQAAAVCAKARGNDVLVTANFNAPGQVVISGSKAACERAIEAAGTVGVRATPLPVAGAFHSPIMAPAAERLALALKRTAIRPPRCAVVSNVTALPHEADGSGTIEESIRRRLVEQLTSPVRWSQSCQWLASGWPADRAEYHELAPGKTLAGLMRRIEKTIKVAAHDEPGVGNAV
ncbi:MAG: ACP S-malonyltransferase [Phycisphaeraceae bacterium]|nr:ACP S-malonyltransferase [Phycisphaeraceae bacterium]